MLSDIESCMYEWWSLVIPVTFCFVCLFVWSFFFFCFFLVVFCIVLFLFLFFLLRFCFALPLFFFKYFIYLFICEVFFFFFFHFFPFLLMQTYNESNIWNTILKLYWSWLIWQITRSPVTRDMYGHKPQKFYSPTPRAKLFHSPSPQFRANSSYNYPPLALTA